MSRLIDADALRENMQWAIDHGMYDKPYDYLAEIDDAPTVGEWIPVSDELPSEGQVVLAIGDKGTWDVGKFRGTAGWTDDKRMWWWKNKSTKCVEYWMPKDAIPLPNREDGKA